MGEDEQQFLLWPGPGGHLYTSKPSYRMKSKTFLAREMAMCV
jgi:hypothetical protein